jgi:uncharacterized membrane protein
MMGHPRSDRPETPNSPLPSTAMSERGFPTATPAKPPVRRADIAISIVLLVLTALMGVLAAVLGLFSLAFLDHCPPATCSVDGAVNAVGTALIVAVGIGVVGLIITVVQLVRRRPGWPFAVTTLGLCAVTIVFGGVGYSAAVG